MGDKINKEYEEFQEYLDKKEKKLKLLVNFDLDSDIDKALEELNMSLSAAAAIWQRSCRMLTSWAASVNSTSPS